MTFRIARREAAKSQHKQHKLGAVIVKGNRILSTGYNSMRPSKLIGTNTLHAEAAAVLKLLKQNRLHDLSGSHLYVSRFTRGGAIGMAKPCNSCMDLLKSVGIRCVHYTTDTGVETLKL